MAVLYKNLTNENVFVGSIQKLLGPYEEKEFACFVTDDDFQLERAGRITVTPTSGGQSDDSRIQVEGLGGSSSMTTVQTQKLTDTAKAVVTGVTTLAPADSFLAISAKARITQVIANHSAGTGPFVVQFFADAAKQELIFNARYTSARMVINKLDLDFENEDLVSVGKVYYTITVTDPGSHDFKVKIFYEVQ